MISINQNELSLKLNNSSFTAVITNSEKNMNSISIPISVNYQSQDYVITSIGNKAFMQNYQIESVYFPENTELLTIGKYAFSESSLKSISIPASVTKIGEACFSRCTHLESVEFPINSKLKQLYKNTFFSTKIERLFIPSSIEGLKDGWCDNTPKLNKIIVSPSNKKFSFIDNKYLIGKSDILNNGFYDTFYMVRRDIEKVIVPSFITKIAAYAMSDCASLKTVDFSFDGNLKTIGKFAFFSSSIELTSLPPSLKELGSSCFANCLSLKAVHFHDDSKLTEIEEMTFYNSSIVKVSIPRNIRKICSNAFAFCKNLRSIQFMKNSELTSINSECFQFSAIEYISIPKTVTNIGKSAFYNCDKLKEIQFQSDSELTSIGESAFENSSIEHISVPRGVTRLEDCSFFGCAALVCAEFLGSSMMIGSQCFSCAHELWLVAFPNSSRIKMWKNSICDAPNDFTVFACANAKIDVDY